MSVQARIGSIPVVGYLLKVVHDVCMLPIMRRHLLQEIRENRSREVAELEDRLSASIKALKRDDAPQDLRALEQHFTALAAFARKAARDHAALSLQLAAACERIAALEAARPVATFKTHDRALGRTAHG